MPEMENTENRKLADEPVFNPELLDPFPVEYEKYYNDHFSLRNQLVKLKSYLVVNVFNKSPMPNKVIFGTEGWLHLVPKELEEYRGTNLLSQLEIDKIAVEFKRRKDYLEKRNSKLYIVIAPIKYSIYPEYLPVYVDKINKTSRTDQIISALRDNNISVLDLRPHEIKAKEKGLVYYKTDNHWNNLGGFYAYKALIDKIKIDFKDIPVLSIDDFDIKTEVVKGRKTAKLLNMIDEFEDIKYELIQKTPSKTKKVKSVGYPMPKNFPYDYAFEMNYETANDSLPKLLFIRDSFGSALIPYLNQSFKRSLFVFDGWIYRSNEHIIEKEQPDVVVFMILESMWDGFLKGIDKSPTLHLSNNNQK